MDKQLRDSQLSRIKELKVNISRLQGLGHWRHNTIRGKQDLELIQGMQSELAALQNKLNS